MSLRLGLLSCWAALILPDVNAVAAQLVNIWEKEMTNSLDANIHGTCKWQYSQGFSMPNNSHTFLAAKYFPSDAEFAKFQSLAPTLTKANPNLINVANDNNFYNWSKETTSQWQIIWDHPAQKRKLCYEMTTLASKDKVLDLYQSFKSVHRTFYLLRQKNAVIHPMGSVSLGCGYYQGSESCETRWEHAQNWNKKCNRFFAAEGLTWDALWNYQNAPTVRSHYMYNNVNNTMLSEEQIRAVAVIKNCTTHWETFEEQWKALDKSELFIPKFYKRVFVIQNQWDYNYHHNIAEALPRLIRNIKFLRANPDIYIHIRANENYDTVPIRSIGFKETTRKVRTQLFHLLGIAPHRIIWDIVIAEEVYIPRTLHCGYALSNPMEIRLLAKELLRGAFADSTPQQKLKYQQKIQSGATKKNLIIQQRYSSGGSSERTWNNQTFDEVVNEFTLMFPTHNIVRMSSLTVDSPDFCLACEIREYANADVLVGLHGAGLTNEMFMPPGSLVVEFVAKFDNVNMPLCGYYGPYSAIFGHHHYIHGYMEQKDEPVRADQAAKKAHEFYMQIKNNEIQPANITTFMYEI